MPTITFCLADGSEHKIEVPAGTKITQAAYKAGVRITQTCGGTPSCTDCKVVVIQESSQGSLEPMQGAEARLLGNVFHITKERLSCQAVIKDSLTIKVPFVKVSKQEDRE